MKFEDLPSHIRKRWEFAEAFNGEKRRISTLIPSGQGGQSYENQGLEEFVNAAAQQINRNSNGLYLAWEVSRLVADSLFWIDEDEKSLLLDISNAVKSGELSIQRNIPGNSSPLKKWETFQSLSHYLCAEPVNDWLQKKGVKFKLPSGVINKMLSPINTDAIGLIKSANNYSLADELLPLNCIIFELTDMGAAHWLAIDGWTLHEAAVLLSGANPKRLEEFDKDPYTPKPDFESCGYIGIFDRLSRAVELGILSFPATPSDVCTWAAKRHGIPAPLLPALTLSEVSNAATHPSQKKRWPMEGEVTYSQLMFERLQPKTKWKGGRITDTDILTLEDAARMASKHAGEDVTVGDYLRAAGRGEILLRAIVHRQAKVQSHEGGVYCNKGMDNENIVPAGSIPTLPLTACQQLAAAGHASWRTFDGFETIGGIPMRFTKAMLTDDEPDFETLPADCRVMGNDVHALADTFIAPDSPQHATPTPGLEVGSLVESAKARPVPVTTRAMADSFAGLHWNATQWIKKLGDKPVWLDGCIVSNRSRGEGMREWNPVLIGAYLARMGHVQPKSVRAKFQTQEALKPWLEVWRTYEDDNFPTA